MEDLVVVQPKSEHDGHEVKDEPETEHKLHFSWKAETKRQKISSEKSTIILSTSRTAQVAHNENNYEINTSGPLGGECIGEISKTQVDHSMFF